MNILLTGGSGFIGKNILESFLSEKYNIIAPSHAKLDLLEEKQVWDFFSNNEIDVVIHSAYKPCHRNAKDHTDIFQCNNKMFFNLLTNSSCYEKLIILSSGAIYDTKYDISKVSEDYFDSNIPSDEPGFQKYICAKQLELMDNVTELRIFGIFGKYEDYVIRFISNAICKTLFDLPITIKQNRKFDYIYVNDLMPVLDYFIQNTGSHRAYNVTSHQAIDLYELAEKVLKISGKNLPIVVKESGAGLEYSGDNSRLCQEITDLKFTPVDEAISNLYGWYSANIHLINREFLLVDK